MVFKECIQYMYIFLYLKIFINEDFKRYIFKQNEIHVELIERNTFKLISHSRDPVCYLKPTY